MKAGHSGSQPYANDRDDFTVRDPGRLIHPYVAGQEFRATSHITHEKLSIGQLVSRHLIESEAPVQPGRLAGHASGKAPNLHGRVHHRHQRTLRFGDGFHDAWECRGVRLGAYESPKALVSRMAHQDLKTQTYGIRIRCSASRHLCLS